MRKRVAKWSTAQRAVVAVGWAGVLYGVWEWFVRDGWNYTFGPNDGWFNYAPNAGVVFSGELPSLMVTNPTLRFAVQVVFVLVWALPSFWLFSVSEPADDDVVSTDLTPDG
ncbi:MAG: hypothetical protein ACK4V6_19195 [Microthrixaceae bacterium]